MMSKDYPNLRSFLQILPLSGLTYSINCFRSLLFVFFTIAICTSYVLWLKNYLISFCISFQANSINGHNIS